MKLHLPVKLLRAVMALFVIHGAIAASWAQESTQKPGEYTIDADVTYGYKGEPWAGKIPEWVWENGSYVLKDGVDLIFTYSPPTPTPPPTPPSLVFNGKEGAFNGDSSEAGYAAVVGNIVTIKNLYNVQFTGFDGNSYAVYTPELTIQNNTNVKVDNNTGETNIYSGIVTLSGNDSIVMSHNAVEYRESRLESGEIVKKGSPVSGGVIGQWSDDFGVYVLGNGEVVFSENKIVADGWEAYGGVIYTDGQVSLKENTKVSFTGNWAESNFVEKYTDSYNPSTQHSYAYGGAICSDYTMWEQDCYPDGELKWEDALDSNGNPIKLPVYREKDDPYGVSICGNKDSGNYQVVEFIGNTVVGSMGAKGGAIYNNDSKTLLSGNESLRFEENTAKADRVEPNGGVAGGAIYSRSSLTITGNGNILFDKNTISTVGGLAYGSAIAVEEGGVFIQDNEGTITVSNNGVTGSGEQAAGAVMSKTTLDISSNDRKITFSGNYINDVEGTSGYSQLVAGAAITAFGSVTINENGIIESNQDGIVFEGNTIKSKSASAFGGAMGNVMGDIAFCSNVCKIEFTGNTASTTAPGNEWTTAQGWAWGGAIATCAPLASILFPGSTAESSVVFDGNEDISFTDNSVSAPNGVAKGGAIYSSNKVTLNNNGNVSFGSVVNNGGVVQYENGNSVQGIEAKGGAIYSEGDVDITSNDDVTFVSNSATDGRGSHGGGAIYSRGSINLSENRNVLVSGNKLSTEFGKLSQGAAIYSSGDVVLSDNTSVSFVDNNITGSYHGRGGAIFSEGSITIAGNGEDGEDVLFQGNSITTLPAESFFQYAYGGALYANENVVINGNTGTVSFIGNTISAPNGEANGEAKGGAIYANCGLSIVNNGDVTFQGNYVKAGEFYNLNSIYVGYGKVELAAADDKSITFYDSVEVCEYEADEEGEGDTIVLNRFTDTEGNLQTSGGKIIFSGATTEADLTAAKGSVAVTDKEIAASRTSIIARNVSVAAGSLEVVDGAQLEMLSLTVDAEATLVLGAGSGITTTQDVTFSAGANLMVQAVAGASTLTLDEAAVPSASITAESVTLSDGMTFTMDGAYLDLSGVNDLSLGEAITFSFGKEATFEKDGTLYFVVFSGYTGLNKEIIDGDWYTHNLDDRGLQNVKMGYDKGILYFSATAPVPEPTTATLSLLALAGLAARRRRK